MFISRYLLIAVAEALSGGASWQSGYQAVPPDNQVIAVAGSVIRWCSFIIR